LGRASDPSRTAETWRQNFAGFSREIYGAESKATFANLENIPNQSRLPTRSVDFFTVHTVWFEILFVFVVLAHDRRRVVHFNVTGHPTAEWTAQQMLEAFPFDTASKYLLRDRDRIYGEEFRKQVEVMNIKEVLSAPRSPWQRAYVERVIGSIRRECLDHVIVFDEESLRRTLRSYFCYYHRSRLHLSLDKDSPDSRSVQSVGRVIAFPEVGGLQHRYERVA
jgi:transposase InsO family protein